MLAKLADLLLRGFIKISFPLWQALGLHVTRNHYYEPIPDTRRLPSDLWQTRSQLAGIDLREADQLALLQRFTSLYKTEYDALPLDRATGPGPFYLNNGQFLGVDSEILYCMIREFKPRRIFEIGSGYSTCLSAQAIQKNAAEDGSYACDLIAIDPNPPAFLRAGLPGLSRLIQNSVQDIPISFFQELTDRDILFIDSSHVLKIGSDVQYEYLEILPSLQPGVLVHLHDIFLPGEYPREWVIQRHRFWNEQYLLQAFLAFNSAFTVLWAGSFLHVKHPDRLDAAFRTYNRQETWQGRSWLPGSFWLRKTAATRDS